LLRKFFVSLLFCTAVTATGQNISAPVHTKAISTDLCVRLQAAIDALPAAGGTVDLRAVSGVQSCGTTVRISGKTVTILLGPIMWMSKVLPMFYVSGYEKATKFNLLCDHPLTSTLRASHEAHGASTALLQLGEVAGDGSRTNSMWGRVEGCGFDGGGVADAIVANSYTAGEFSRLSIFNYAHRGLYLHHAWDTTLRSVSLDHGAPGAVAALVLDDASSTVLEKSMCYAGRALGVSCVLLEGVASSTVALRSVDCGDDYACVVLPKLSQPVTGFLFDHVYFENQETPVSIGEQGNGQAPRNVTFAGGHVSANPVSGDFQLVEADGVQLWGMTLQRAWFSRTVRGLRLIVNY
jgi:hypothetical protein